MMAVTMTVTMFVSLVYYDGDIERFAAMGSVGGGTVSS